MADWSGVPAGSTADIDMVGSSGREWTEQQSDEALTAGTAVATSSQHLESHQVAALLPSLTPVLRVDFMETCGSKDALHASLVVLNTSVLMNDTTAYPSTDTSDGITWDCGWISGDRVLMTGDCVLTLGDCVCLC